MALSDKLVAAAMKNLEKLLISKGFTAESLIAKFDINNDGLINLDEFDKGLTKLTGSPAPRSYLSPIFSAIDIDGNGNLSQNELMALLGIENKTTIDSNSLEISGHKNEKYNGTYLLQNSKINNKPWYENSNNCRLYFYDANEGGAPSWSLDDRQQDGSNDWYGGGWTRVPADQNIPIGIRRFVGAGKITISESQDSNLTPNTDSDDVVELVDEEFDMTTFVNSWSNKLEEVLDASKDSQGVSTEEFDSIIAEVNLAFEEEVSQLPLLTQAPVRAIWKIKSDTAVTIAKTQLSSNNANIVTGLGIAGAAVGAVGAVSSIGREKMPLEDTTILEGNTTVDESKPILIEEKPDSQDWHDEHHVEAPDRVELPDRVTVNKPLSHSEDDLAGAKEIIVDKTPDKALAEIPSPVIDDSTLSIDEVITKMSDARFLTEQRELLTDFKGQIFTLSFRVNSVDRTFGIGVSQDYKGGNTLLVNSNSHEIEVRTKKEFDISKILSGTEMTSNISVADWNGVRKRLVVNLH